MASGNWYTPDGGNGSLTVNGQILQVPMSSAFYPSNAQAPYYNGSGQPPPTIPLNYLAGGGAINQQQASTAASMPFNPAQSPLIISVAALIIGVLGLRYVHWRG
jgi:hypothetical protein